MGTPVQPPANDTSRLFVWVKGLEGKLNNLLREMNIIKNDAMKKQSQLRFDVKAMNDDLLELKREQEKINQKIDLIIRELKQTAGAEEVLTLKKYLDLWNPLNFVTQRDLDRALDSRLAQRASTPDIQPKKINKRTVPLTKKGGES